MGTLRVGVSGSGLRTEHARILRTLVKRGEEAPERTEEDRLQGTYHPEAITIARHSWRERMVHEHESAAVFSGVLPDLMAAEAPLDVKTAMLRCSVDELRHAGLCGQVVEFLGGEAVAEADLQITPVPKHKDCSAKVAAIRNVLFASLSETVSVGLLTEERERTTEPFLKRVLKQLSGDEVLHARVGWTYLGMTYPELDAQERDDLRAYIPVALAHLQDCMLGAMPLGAPIPDEILVDALKLGFSYSPSTRELFFATMREIIVPQLDQFELGAQEAWDEVAQG